MNYFTLFFFLQFNVEEILQKSEKGNIVLSFYLKNKKLNDICRKHISDIVIEYLIHNKIHGNPTFLEKVANNIVDYFKSEVKVSIIKT